MKNYPEDKFLLWNEDGRNCSLQNVGHFCPCLNVLNDTEDVSMVRPNVDIYYLQFFKLLPYNGVG